MPKWNDLILEIQETARREATTAPELFADLAQLEKYIAETYQRRALYELIQNADDSESDKAMFLIAPSFSIFANNGAPFTDQDFRAICRSGSSIKRLTAGKIGYRGIGFKSTVNLSRRIHVISSGLEFTFASELTASQLGVDRVPTIRMPHVYTPTPTLQNAINQTVGSLVARGYSTLFVFESPQTEAVNTEFEEIDGESLLFTRKVQELVLQTESLTRKLQISRKLEEFATRVDVLDGSRRSNWTVFTHPKDAATAVALPLKISDQPEATNRTYPVHCFLPTQENTGYAFRINANVSTDPSRTRIEFDLQTQAAIERIAETILALLGRGIKLESPPDWFIQALDAIAAPISFTRVGERITKALKTQAKGLMWLSSETFNVTKLRTRPDWLNRADFQKLVSQETEAERAVVRFDSLTPAAGKFLGDLGIKPLDFADIAPRVSELSEIGKVESIGQIIDRLRATGDSNLHLRTEAMELWISKKGQPCNLEGAKRGLSDRFTQILSAKLSPAQARWVTTNWKIPVGDAEVVPSIQQEDKPITETSQPAPERRLQIGRAVRRWRRSEENLSAVLAERLKAQVIDVSQSNLGYDFEVIYPAGKREYIEVKQITRERGEFALTNNEYASATSLGPSYIVAVCMQDDSGFAWALIRDPVKNLQLVKRCRQWEWFCNDSPVLTDRQDFGGAE